MKTILSNNTIKLAVFALTVLLAAAARPQAEAPALSSAFVFGADISYNFREGYRKFDGLDEYLRVEQNGLWMFTGMVGKRFAFGGVPWLRVQAAVEGGWGSVKDGEIPVTFVGSGETVMRDLHTNYITGGATAEAHIVFPTDNEDSRAYFISLGPGFHLTGNGIKPEMKRNEKILGWESDWRYAASFSLNVGGGIERRISDRMASVLAYNFRLWQPVRHIDSENMLFPMGVEYREVFYSHSLQFQLLLPGSKHARFD